MQVISKMLRSKFAVKNEQLEQLDAIKAEVMAEFASLGQMEVRVST